MQSRVFTRLTEMVTLLLGLGQIEQANSHHPTIRFTAEISGTETTFLRKYTKAKDSIEKQCLMCLLTSNLLKLSYTRTIYTPPARQKRLYQRRGP